MSHYTNNIIDNISMGANIATSPISVQDSVSYSLHITWSGGGTPIGTIDIVAANNINSAQYSTILSTPLSVSGNSGDYLVNIEKHAYAYVKVLYTRTSGSGTLIVALNGKTP